MWATLGPANLETAVLSKTFFEIWILRQWGFVSGENYVPTCFTKSGTKGNVAGKSDSDLFPGLYSQSAVDFTLKMVK